LSAFALVSIRGAGKSFDELFHSIPREHVCADPQSARSEIVRCGHPQTLIEVPALVHEQ
jgi:hypothetical protein